LEIFWSLYPTRQSNTARRAVTVLASINTPAPIVTASVECIAHSAKGYAFAEVAQIIGKCLKMPMHAPS
jgi:hypothetical protein